MADASERIIILTAVVLVVSIVISTQMYQMELHSLELPDTVIIGVISPTDEDLQKYEFFVNIAKQEINNYTSESGLETTFEFNLYSGEGTSAKSLEIIQLLHDEGVDLVVGGARSSQLFAMESYVNENDLIVISPSSASSQSQLVKSDNIFRLSPHDFMLGDDMANIIAQYGVKAVVVIAREDAWGEGVAGRFGASFEENGGVILDVVLYSPFLEDGIGNYLDEAEAIIANSIGDYSQDEIGVFLLSFNEVTDILRKTPEYPWLENVTWFSSDYVANKLVVLEARDEAATVKMVSPLPLSRLSIENMEEVRRFSDQFQSHIDFYLANIYDACWIMALSVLEAGTVVSSMVVDVVSEVAAEYSGMTGMCILDEFGDRSSYTLGVYGIDVWASGPRWVLFGIYDSVTENVMWEKEYAPGIG